MICSVEGCGKDAKRADMCWAHHRQTLKKGGTSEVRAYGRAPKAMLTSAALQYADAADDPRAWDLAWHRLRVAAKRYVKAEKRNDPRRRRH